MPLYRTANNRWVSTQKEAGKGFTAFEVPKTVPEMLKLLNDNTPAAQPEKASPAYKQGRSDAQRGITANPYGLPYEREEWERGHAEAFEMGVAPHPSFKVLTRDRVKRERKR